MPENKKTRDPFLSAQLRKALVAQGVPVHALAAAVDVFPSTIYRQLAAGLTEDQFDGYMGALNLIVFHRMGTGGDRYEA